MVACRKISHYTARAALRWLQPDGRLLLTDGREDRVVDSFQIDKEKKEKFLNGLIVWAGLIATAGGQGRAGPCSA